MGLQDDYELLAGLANVAEAGGLTKERAILLLWYLRSVMGIDDLDAYEYVCDGDDDGGIDGLYLEDSGGDDEHVTLVIFQSKYPIGPNQVGRTSIESLVAAADKFETADGLRTFLQGSVEPQLRLLIDRFGLLQLLSNGDFASGKLRIRLVFVTAGTLTAEAKAFLSATNDAHHPAYLATADLYTLGRIARSVTTTAAPSRTISIQIPAAERLLFGASPDRILMAAVKASDVVAWPGIDDRTLFELNVRRELRRNQVRRQLDAALERAHEHADFLAYHNGLTITCDGLDLHPDSVLVTNPSVVNGAQSVVAFYAASLEGLLTEDLRIFAKFVETKERPGLAQQVSKRSNTQNPVNARNLMANSHRQKRLAADFESTYPGYIYETKPDASLTYPAGKTVLQNDDIAQLLCAVFNAEPWLAVKRNVLFEADNHPKVFNESVTPAHIILVHHMGKVVDEESDRFPAEYRRSWRLTRLIAVYLVSQMMRAAEAGTDERHTLEDPAWAITDLDRLRGTLRLLTRYAAATMRVRRDRMLEQQEFDDFKVAFKQQTALGDLRERARESYLTYETVKES